jgi:hypothetical protein
LNALAASPNKMAIITDFITSYEKSAQMEGKIKTIEDLLNTTIVSPNLAEKVKSAGFGANLLMILLVGGMFAGALWTAWTFRLNSYTHKVLMDEIERFRKVDLLDDNAIRAARATVDPETKRVVEELTGLDYDRYAWSGDLVNGDTPTVDSSKDTATAV